MGWACGANGWGERGVYRVLVGKPEGKRQLGRPRHRWVDNIRMDLCEVECGYMDWIGLAQDRDRWRTLVSVAMNLRVPWNVGNFLTSFSRRTLHHGVSIVSALISRYLNLLHLWRMCCLPWWHDSNILVMRHSSKIVQVHCHQRKPLLHIFFLNRLKYPQVNFWFYPVISLEPLRELLQLQYADRYWELQIFLYLFDKKVLRIKLIK